MWLLALIAAAAAVVVGLRLAEAWRQARDRRLGPPGTLVDIGARRLQLIAKGDGRPTVVLITGGGEPAGFLAPVQDRVAAFARVCAYDRAGFGWSDPAPAPLSFSEHARDLHELLARAGETGPFVLVAESLGGLIARAFARDYPADVAGLLLLDAAEEQQVFGNLDRLHAAGKAQLRLISALSFLGLLRFAVGRILPKAYSPEMRRQLAAVMSRAAQWRAVAWEVQAYDLTPMDERHAGGFGSIAAPLTVIAHGRPFRGAQASLEEGWRAGQERLAALSPQSRFVVAERAGHAIAQEQPDLVANEIRALIQRVG